VYYVYEMDRSSIIRNSSKKHVTVAQEYHLNCKRL
jgi:hypothetical protein